MAQATKSKAETTPPAEPEPDAPGEGEGEGEGEGDRPAETAAPGVTPDESGEPVLPEGMALCPVCAGAGAVPEFVHQDPQTRTCETCGGIGELVTGSLVPDRTTQTCRDCGGSGYVALVPEPGAYAPAPPLEPWQTPAPLGQPVPLTPGYGVNAGAGAPGY